MAYRFMILALVGILMMFSAFNMGCGDDEDTDTVEEVITKEDVDDEADELEQDIDDELDREADELEQELEQEEQELEQELEQEEQELEREFD